MIASRHASSCARRLRVLADDTRLSVLRQLACGPKYVHELNATLGIEQSLLSHHLQVLREGGLVVSKRIGRGVLYRLAGARNAERPRRAGRRSPPLALSAGRAARGARPGSTSASLSELPDGSAIDLGCCRLSFD